MVEHFKQQFKEQCRHQGKTLSRTLCVRGWEGECYEFVDGVIVNLFSFVFVLLFENSNVMSLAIL